MAPITPADASVAGFLQSIALAVADVYDKLTPFVSDTTKPIATKFQGHHIEHADALVALAGTAAAKLPNQALALVLGARLPTVTDERSALAFAFGVENQVTETYAATFNTVTSPDLIHLVATMLPIVAGHATTIGSLAGLAPIALFPNGALEGTAAGDGSDTTLGFDPALFPVS
jgi:hypothetical protein